MRMTTGSSIPFGTAIGRNRYEPRMFACQENRQRIVPKTTRNSLGRIAALIAALWLFVASIGVLPALAIEEVAFVHPMPPEIRAIPQEYFYRQSTHYRDAIADGDMTLDDVWYGLADLDDDGVKEIFFYVSVIGFCGSAGCTTEILRKTASGWLNIGETSTQGSAEILDEKDDGYRRLRTHKVLIWDGEQYNCIKGSDECG